MGSIQMTAGRRVLDERGSGMARNGTRKVDTGLAGKQAAYVNIVSASGVGQARPNGWLEAWAEGAMPESSALNYVGGQDSNMVLLVPLAADGTFMIFTSTNTFVIVDVRGYLEFDAVVLPLKVLLSEP